MRSSMGEAIARPSPDEPSRRLLDRMWEPAVCPPLLACRLGRRRRLTSPGRDRISSERATHRPRARFGHHPAVPTLRRRRPSSEHRRHRNHARSPHCRPPLVLVPQGADQFTNAASCQAAGVGRALMPADFTPTAVRDAVRTVLEPSSAERTVAQHIAAEIAQMPTATGVVFSLAERTGAGC
jgi:hypothetical protein